MQKVYDVAWVGEVEGLIYHKAIAVFSAICLEALIMEWGSLTVLVATL